jgi:hypothetical protein
LGDNLQKLRGEVFRLVRAEPVLHLVHLDDYALNTVRIVYQLPPVSQFVILVLIAQVRNTLALWVFLLPAYGLFHEGHGFTGALSTSEDNNALMPEILRIAREIILCVPDGELEKQGIKPEGPWDVVVLTFGAASAPEVEEHEEKKRPQAEDSESQNGTEEGNTDNLPEPGKHIE